MDWLSTFAGWIVGMVVGFTGVGGGALMTPLLVLMFGVSPQMAVGTDLLYATVTKCVGSSIHGAPWARDSRLGITPSSPSTGRAAPHRRGRHVRPA